MSEGVHTSRPEQGRAALPTPSFIDHIRVFGLLIRTLVEGIPYLLVLPICVLLRLFLRSRARKRLRARDRSTSLDQPPRIDTMPASGTIFLAIGEESGDKLAARMVAAIRAGAPGVVVRGYGGPACAKAGMQVDRDITSHAVMGTWSVVASLGTWWKICAQFLAIMREQKPDLLLTVDFPGLNGRFAQWAKRAGVRTVHMVAPQVWAHAPWRAGRWRRAVDLMLSVFPFEPTLHAASGMRSVYVGHPLFEAPLDAPRTPVIRPTDEHAVIELWPGSRKRELKNHARLTFQAARAIRPDLPRAAFVVRLARTEHASYYAALDGFDEAADPRKGWIRLAGTDEAPSNRLLGAIACSGTATAELAVALVPTVVFYRISWLQRLGAWGYLNAPWFSLPNVIAGKEVLPEHLLVPTAKSGRLAASFLFDVASPEAWKNVRNELSLIRGELETHDVASRCAQWVCAELARVDSLRLPPSS